MSKPDPGSELLLVATAGNTISDDNAEMFSKAIADHCGKAPHVTRLGDTAIDFALFRNTAGLRKTLEQQFCTFEVDFNILPSTGRKKKLFLADMDATLIANECIDELAEFAKVQEQVRTITTMAMNGEIDFEQSIKQRVALLKDLPEQALGETYEQRIKLNPGAMTLGHILAKFGVITGIVSSGFDYFADRVANRINFRLTFSNQLEIKHGRLTGRVKEPILGPNAKRLILERLCRQEGIDMSEVMCVGDGANDIPIINAAGLGVAYHAKPVLEKRSTTSIRHSDLTALLYLQGYHQSEF